MTREEFLALRRRLTAPVSPRRDAPASTVREALHVPALAPHAAALLAFAEHRMRGGREVPEWIADELRSAAEQRDRQVAEALRRAPRLHRT